MATERQELVSDQSKEKETTGQFLQLVGLEPDQIAYNPARPVRVLDPRTGKLAELMPIRVESRDSTSANLINQTGIYDPQVVLFERVGNNGTWSKADLQYWGLDGKTDFFRGLEDPFVTFVQGEIIFGGVRVKPSTDQKGVTISSEFYGGKSFSDLHQFAEIEGMKDIRILELPSGNLLVSSRPQGEEAGRGRIGFVKISNLSQLRQSVVYNAPILRDQVQESSWVGVNELHLLSTNGTTTVGVLGHIAHRDESGILNYAAITFAVLDAESVDRQKPEVTPINIIAERSDWSDAKPKRAELDNVVFPGGLVGNSLYVGIKDARVGVKHVENPFNLQPQSIR